MPPLSVNPRIVVADGNAAVEFYVTAFGANEIGERYVDDAGRLVHAMVRIGTSDVLITEDPGDTDAPARSPDHLGGLVSAVMSMKCADVDIVWERARKAGAEVIYELQDQFYGERAGRLRDPFGQQWILNQPLLEQQT
jgi:PhnB protein